MSDRQDLALHRIRTLDKITRYVQAVSKAERDDGRTEGSKSNISNAPKLRYASLLEVPGEEIGRAHV